MQSPRFWRQWKRRWVADAPALLLLVALYVVCGSLIGYGLWVWRPQ